MKIFSTAPDANVIFYPFVKEDTTTVSLNEAMKVSEVSVKEHILELQTQKQKGATGTFSLLLDSSKNWKSILNPGCWCLIYLSNQPLTGKELSEPDSGLKMIGVVRSIMRQEAVDTKTGIKNVRFLVTGEDFQSIFNSMIYVNLQLSTVSGNAGDVKYIIYGPLFKKVFLNPSNIVQLLINTFLGKEGRKGGKSNDSVIKPPAGGARSGQPIKVPIPIIKRIMGENVNQNLFTGMITTFIQKNLPGLFYNPPEILGVQQIWSVLTSFSNRLMNEIYTDILPVNINGKTRLVPSIVLRAIPFSQKKGKPHQSCISMLEAGGDKAVVGKRGRAVKTKTTKREDELAAERGAHFYVSHDISEEEIVRFTSGKTDRERFNFFLSVPNFNFSDKNNKTNPEMLTLAQVNQRGGLNTISRPSSITRYGLRPYVAKSSFFFDNLANNPLLITDIVRDIWEKAYLYESGQVELIGQAAHIPVGTNIRFIDRKWLAHVEGVNHSFMVDAGTGIKSFRTQIAFVRLQLTNGNPVDLTEQTDIFDESGQLEIQNDTGVDRGVNFVKLDKG